MFGAPFSQKTRACFVRRCDATHLAAPKQEASAMKLLVAAENAPEDKPSNCSFGVGFNYRHGTGHFDRSRGIPSSPITFLFSNSKFMKLTESELACSGPTPKFSCLDREAMVREQRKNNLAHLPSRTERVFQ